jgi:hypothetical protein
MSIFEPENIASFDFDFFFRGMIAGLSNHYRNLSVASYDNVPANIYDVLDTWAAMLATRRAEEKAEYAHTRAYDDSWEVGRYFKPDSKEYIDTMEHEKVTKRAYILALKVTAHAILAAAQALYTALKARFDEEYAYADDSARAKSGFYETEADIKLSIHNLEAKITELAEETGTGTGTGTETGTETKTGIETGTGTGTGIETGTGTGTETESNV